MELAIIITYIAMKLIASVSFLYLLVSLINKAGGGAAEWVSLAVYGLMIILSIPLGAMINLMEDN